VIVTRLTIAVGVVFLAFLFWLVLRGFTTLGIVLVTFFVLFAFVAGGSLLGGRGSGRSGRGGGPGPGRDR
jgi:hypothetical protein